MENRPPPFFDSLVGKRIAGRYLVDRMLGSGGMGIVAAARYPELGQKVAIKFLRPELALDGVVSARFMREARVAAKVKSAHFVRVYDVGTLDTGIPYLVMEMLTGKDLGDELRDRGPLPVADAVDCILQAMIGVAEIHALGIVHRDLKPSNLFIANVAGATIVKVLDFGISKEKKSESLVPLTSTDHVLGTPQYMSPEQVRASKDVDIRSDVWSLGVILYELVTQSLPFKSEGGGVGEMFGKILYVDPDPPSVHRKDLPEGLEAVILKCITRDVDKRYANVVELAEALRPFAAATSLHRIEAVRQASVADAPEVDDDPILEVAAESADSAAAIGVALTEQSSPDAKRAQLAVAPTAVSGKGAVQTGNQIAEPEPAPERAPVTAMTSSSVVSKAPPIVKPAGGGRSLALVALGVVVIAGGIGAFVSSRGATPTSTATPASASAAMSADPPAMASVAMPAGAITLPTPSAAPSAPAASASNGASVGSTASSAASSASSASASSASSASAVATKPRASGIGVVAPRPTAHGVAGGAAATGTSAAAPKTSAPALILDRK